jgi:nucleoside-diphosphate-sugar epimerase
VSEDQPVVMLTGSSGFVGRHMAPALARSGWVVRRAVRQPSGKADEATIDSIGPVTDWRAALAGVDAVVHLAARVHHRREEHAVELYRTVNLEGTLHLARCAAEAGVRHFIFVSTVLVHGRTTDGRRPFNESDVLTPRGLYGMSKAAAEAGLRQLAQGSQMKVTIIRPPLIYGSGAKGNMALLEKAVGLGIPLPFANVRNRRAFISVENLTSFVLHRLLHPDGQFNIFLVADDEQVSTPEFIERLAVAAGKPARLFSMPRLVLSSLFSITGRNEANESLFGSLELDLSKVAATGWRPLIGLNEGLRRAVHGIDL